MRDVEFRGKICIDGHYGPTGRWTEREWVYGSLVHQTDFYGDKVDRYYIIDGTNTQDYDIGPEYRVLEETVGQYVGREDKTGRKIYEGDILKGKHYPFCYDGEYNYYGEVCWFDEEAQFGIWVYKRPGTDVVGRSTGNMIGLDVWESELWEVIGNVHDNPELTFEGGKNDSE